MNGCRPVYTQGWNDERKLLKKMVEVYKQVQYIQKRGHNKFHNYKYATEADVNEKVREELSERGIIMMPGIVNKELRTTITKSGNTEYIYRVDMEFNFMDSETGESLVVPMSGEGQDVGDKAIFKAISGCQKYALMKAFMIPTGDDPEGDESVDERNHREPIKAPTKTVQASQNNSQTNTPTTTQTQPTSQSNTSSGISAAQIKYAHTLKSKKKISEDDFSRMVSEHGNDSLAAFTMVQAKTFINFLTAIADPV